MAPYVYCKHSAPKCRPKSLDIDPTSRLVGGRNDDVAGGLQSLYVPPPVLVERPLILVLLMLTLGED